MQRREYLAATGTIAALALAGCSGGGDTTSALTDGGTTDADAGTESPVGDAETDTTESAATTTTTTEAAETTEAAATDAEPETASPTAAATDSPTATPESGGDDGGPLFTTARTPVSVELTDAGDTDVTIESAEAIEGLSIERVEWFVGDDGFTQGVRGEITNTSDSALSYVEIQTYFYDSEGTRLGEGLDNASELGPDETYAFEALYAGGSEDAQVVSYSITADTGF